MGIYNRISLIAEKILQFPRIPPNKQSQELSIDKELEQYYEMIYLICLKILENEEEAFDAAHKVISVILEKKPPMDSPKDYLAKAARNESINMINKKKGREKIEEYYKSANIAIHNWIIEKNSGKYSDDPQKQRGDIGTIDKSYEETDGEMTIPYMMDILDEEDEITRAIIKMYYWDGLSFDEIAERVGKAKSTVSERHSKFLKRARAKLGKVNIGKV